MRTHLGAGFFVSWTHQCPLTLRDSLGGWWLPSLHSLALAVQLSKTVCLSRFSNSKFLNFAVITREMD